MKPGPSPTYRDLSGLMTTPLPGDHFHRDPTEPHPPRHVYFSAGKDVLKLGRPSAMFNFWQNLWFWLAALVKCV